MQDNRPDEARRIAQYIQDNQRENRLGYELNAIVLSSQGDRAAALRVVKLGLENIPNDPELEALRKMLEPKVNDSNIASSSLKIKSMLDGLNAQANPESEVSILKRGFGEMARTEAGAVAGLPEKAQIAGAGPSLSPSRLAHLGHIASTLPVPGARISPEEARLNAAIAKNPKDEAAYRYRALERRQRGELEGALADARRAVELAPNDPWALKVLSLILSDHGQWEMAKAAADLALKMHARDAEAHHLRAMALAGQGKTEQMMGDLKKAAELDPTRYQHMFNEALAAYSPKSKIWPWSGLSRRIGWSGLGLAMMILALYASKRRQIGEMLSTAGRGDVSRAAVGAAFSADLGPIRIIRPIGEGGMGIVYEGYDPVLGRKVAIKKMRPEVAADPREAQLFLQEARTVAGLSHPNIVQVHNAIPLPDGLFLVFEFVDGENLDSRLGQGAIPPAQALPILTQIAAALDYAHGRGVIHRDLKPANVILSSAREVKVADFGLARRMAESLSRLTRGVPCGTPAYMSPEQEDGLEGAPADVYAFAVTAYEILTGRRPFAEGASDLKRRKAYPPLATISPPLAPADAALAKALDPDPKHRHATAGALAAELRAALS